MRLRSIDDPVGRAGVVFADVGDGVAVEGDVDAAHVDVAARLGLPGDRPIGIFDDGYGHWILLGDGGLGGARRAKRWAQMTGGEMSGPHLAHLRRLDRGSAPPHRGSAYESGSRAGGASDLAPLLPARRRVAARSGSGTGTASSSASV